MVKLLIVDDEALTRNGLIDFIPWRQIGVHEIRGAENGQSALLLAHSFRPDIVISDIRMPGMSGIEFARQLRALQQDCKLIFLSGYADKENLKQAIELGAVRFLEKPIRRSEVISVVESIATQIENEKRAIHAINERAEGQRLLARERLARDLSDWSSAPESVRQRMELAEIDPFAYSGFTSAIARFDSSDHHTFEDLRSSGDALCQGLSAALSAFGLCINYASGNAEVTNHLFMADGSEPLPHELFRSVRESLPEGPGKVVPFFLAIGDVRRDMFSLSVSYRNARQAMGSLFYTGYDAFAAYSPGLNPDKPAPEPPPSLFAALRQFDRAAAESALRSYFQQVRTAQPSPNAARKAYASLMAGILDWTAEVSYGEKTQDVELIRFIYDADTLDGIHNRCVSEFDAIFNRMEANRKIGQTVLTIKGFVNERYADADLSIESLAEKLYMSGTYLCHVFKKKTGSTINAYITNVRMEKARDLLRNQRIKVTSVAAMVGYSSPDHFTKLFRKHTGMGPAEFRDLCASGRIGQASQLGKV